MTRWCIYLSHKSSRVYDLLRRSGIVSLPSTRTLRDYTHYISSQAGFSKVDEQLLEVSQAIGQDEWQKAVIIIFDEMYIKKELVYDKRTGELIGFTNLGAINHK